MKMKTTYKSLTSYQRESIEVIESWLRRVAREYLGWDDIDTMTPEDIDKRCQEEEITINVSNIPTLPFGTTHQIRRKGKYVITLKLGIGFVREEPDVKATDPEGNEIDFDYESILREDC